MVIHFAVYVPISTEAVQAQKLHRKENMQQTAYSVFNPFYELSFPFVKIENIWKQTRQQMKSTNTEMYLIWQYYFEIIIELQVLKAHVQAYLLNMTLDYRGKGAQNWYLA